MAIEGFFPQRDMHVVAQTETALLGIRLTYCVGVALLLAVSIAVTMLYPMTRERHAALLEAIERGKQRGDAA